MKCFLAGEQPWFCVRAILGSPEGLSPGVVTGPPISLDFFPFAARSDFALLGFDCQLYNLGGFFFFFLSIGCTGPVFYLFCFLSFLYFSLRLGFFFFPLCVFSFGFFCFQFFFPIISYDFFGFQWVLCLFIGFLWFLCFSPFFSFSSSFFTSLSFTGFLYFLCFSTGFLLFYLFFPFLFSSFSGFHRVSSF